jgi:orotate phosphoribosyltransferase
VIDKETEVFNAVARALREKIKDIYVIGTEISSAPPKFPAVSFYQTNNSLRQEHSTFENTENVVREEYKAEGYSNLEKGKEAQTKEILMVISDVLSDLGYERTFCEPIPNADATISRRMGRFIKNNVI